MARAQEVECGLVERRGRQVVHARGRLPDGASDDLVGRLRRGERTALETPLRRSGGAFEVELVPSGRLLPGEYRVEVGPLGGAALAAGALVVGDAAAAAAAAELLDAWRRRTVSSVRRLAGLLERNGAYARALARRRPSAARTAGEGFAAFLDGWRTGLRNARMDVLTFRNRLVLAPAAAASDLDDLEAVCRNLDERARAWEAAIVDGTGEPPGPADALEEAARRLEAACGREPPEIDAWRAGPAATPPPWPDEVELEDGVFRSRLGFRIRVPEGFALQEPPPTPTDRLRMVGGGAIVGVSVYEFPSSRTVEDLVDAVEVLNREQFLGYRRFASQRLPDGAGLVLGFEANLAQPGARPVPVIVQQRVLFPPGGRRAFVAYAARSEGTAPTPQAREVLESFALEAD